MGKNGQNHGDSDQELPSKSELLANAKAVAELAKATLNHEPVDKGKAAGAAAGIIGAASHYGKLEKKGYGKILDKAEDYLHKYQTTHTTTTTTTTVHGHSGHSATVSETHTTTYQHHEVEEEDHSGSTGKYGDYIKMAQGMIFKK